MTLRTTLVPRHAFIEAAIERKLQIKKELERWIKEEFLRDPYQGLSWSGIYILMAAELDALTDIIEVMKDDEYNLDGLENCARIALADHVSRGLHSSSSQMENVMRQWKARSLATYGNPRGSGELTKLFFRAAEIVAGK